MQSNYWYVPHPGIRTKTAADSAKTIAEWITGGCKLKEEPDEHALFVALHTCAYRAQRRSRNNDVSAGERTKWKHFWYLIREYIVEKNLGLVYSTIGKFGPSKLDADDLLSDAMFGLTRAVHRFNPWKGCKFSTYACNVIIRALTRHNKRESNYYRLFPVRYDVPFERPDHLQLDDPATELYVERLTRVLNRNLGGLTDLETKILQRRFTADQQRPSTFREIGNSVGLSKERIRQMQNVALSKLRDSLAADVVLQDG